MPQPTSAADGRSPVKKKSKPAPKQQASLLDYKNDKKKLNAVLTKTYVGKRILLTAKSIYGRGGPPEGEEDMLFQYHISKVNEDNKTATIDYDNKCIHEGDHLFQSYPDPQDGIPNYSLSMFKEDQELYLKHLGYEQKKKNDEDAERKKKAREADAAAVSDVSDLELKIEQGENIYDLLMDEYEPDGDLRPHTIAKGPDSGKVIMKQLWCKSLKIVFPDLSYFNH